MGLERMKLLADAFEMAKSTYTTGIKVHSQPFSEDLIGYNGSDFLLLLPTDELKTYSGPRLSNLEIQSYELVLSAGRRFFLSVAVPQDKLWKSIAFLLEIIQDEQHEPEIRLEEWIRKWNDKWSLMSLPLSGKEIRGLVGELLILKYLIQGSNQGIVSIWDGPLDGLRDFTTDYFSIEVKSGYDVLESCWISDLEQLNPSAQGTIQLVLIKLNDNEDISLDCLYLELSNKIEDQEYLDAFKFRMNALGYVPNEVPEYSQKYGIESIHSLSISIESPLMPNDVYAIIPRYVEKMKYKLNTSILPLSESSPEDISSLAERFYN